MLTSSPSPTIYTSARSSPLAFSTSTHSTSSHSPATTHYYDGHGATRSSSTPQKYPSSSPRVRHLSHFRSAQSITPPTTTTTNPARPRMVDASTQYSPEVHCLASAATQPQSAAATSSSSGPGSTVTMSADSKLDTTMSDASAATETAPAVTTSSKPPTSNLAGSKRASPVETFKQPPLPSDRASVPNTNITTNDATEGTSESDSISADGATKRARPVSTLKPMPPKYWHANNRDLVSLIASMLLELIRFNDTLPLSSSALTRFHSRAPPAISVLDYLQRLTTHATLSPPILLSMVFYIDRLCSLYPAFTISSLTVHRFLITAATVASKGLSDSFWTNKTYARVGGLSLRELALLELEFLWRVEWKIVPKGEVLEEYYRNLVERSGEFEIVDEEEWKRLGRESGAQKGDGKS